MSLNRSISSLLMVAFLAGASTATIAQTTPSQRWESLSPEEQDAVVERATEHRSEAQGRRADRRSEAREYWESLSPEAQAAARSEVQQRAQNRHERVQERRSQITDEQRAVHEDRHERREQRRDERRESAPEPTSNP